MNSTTIRRGRAICLVGKKGQDLLPFARAIALNHGSYVEARDARLLLESGFYLGNLLSQRRDTIIVAECSMWHLVQPEIKFLVSNPTVVMHRKGMPEVEVPTPNFIFCMQDGEGLCLHPNERRYLIVDVNERHVA